MTSLEPALIALARRLESPNHEIAITTTELGGLLGVSQQTASRYLAELENSGWIERRRSGRGYALKLTPDGANVLRGIHSNLGRLLESKARRKYEGTVVSGIGEGAYYVGEYADRIRGITGYTPYHGTLNLRFEGGRPRLTAYETVNVDEFKSGDRSFGRAALTPVTLRVKGAKVRCHAIVPERTHHENDLELVAKHNLRRRYNLKDGDKAIVEVN